MPHRLYQGTVAAALALTVGFNNPGAHAQYQGQYTNPYTGRSFNDPMSSMLDTYVLHAQQQRMLRDSFQRRKQPHTGSTSSRLPASNSKRASSSQRASSSKRATTARSSTGQQAAVPSLKQQMAVTTFHPAAKPLMAQTIAATMGRTDNERKQLLQLFTAGLAAYEAEARKRKHPHDLALAMTYFITANYVVYRAAQEPGDRQIARLLDKLRLGLASMPQLQRASDSQKQRLYEALIISAVFTSAGYQQGQRDNDKETQEVFRKLAAQNLQSLLGVSADKMSFTPTGFIIQ